jgi:hypothetical protein
VFAGLSAICVAGGAYALERGARCTSGCEVPRLTGYLLGAASLTGGAIGLGGSAAMIVLGYGRREDEVLVGMKGTF